VRRFVFCSSFLFFAILYVHVQRLYWWISHNVSNWLHLFVPSFPLSLFPSLSLSLSIMFCSSYINQKLNEYINRTFDHTFFHNARWSCHRIDRTLQVKTPSSIIQNFGFFWCSWKSN
jgi:hypothetical protein